MKDNERIINCQLSRKNAKVICELYGYTVGELSDWEISKLLEDAIQDFLTVGADKSI